MINRFMILIKRELKSITREKTIMFAIALQFMIASFSSVMLVGVMAFYDPSSIGENAQMNMKVGVVGDFSNPLMAHMNESSNISIYPFRDLELAEEAFKDHRIDTFLSIPAADSGVVDMDLYLPESDVESTLILMLLDAPLKEAENDLRQANGVQLRYDDLEGKSSTDYEFLYSVIVPLLMFFPALIAGSIVIDTFSEEIQNKTLDTLWSAPVTLNMIFSSKIAAAILTALLQCVLWVVLLQINSFPIENLGLLLLLSAAVAASVSFGAGILGLYFKDRERSQFVYSLALLGVAGLTYLLNPSPFGLITKLAVGDPYVGFEQVIGYLAPLALIAGLFFISSKKLTLAKS